MTNEAFINALAPGTKIRSLQTNEIFTIVKASEPCRGDRVIQLLTENYEVYPIGHYFRLYEQFDDEKYGVKVV